MVKFFLIILVCTLGLNVSAQTKKATLPKRPLAYYPTKQWWWGYSGREVRQQVLLEAGWHSVQPSDSCTFCTAFANGFSCRMEFSYNPEGLWRRTWKIPRDLEAVKQWDALFQRLPVPTYQGAPTNQRVIDGDGNYSTWIWREECGDFIIYTAVGQDETMNFGPSFTRTRPLIDCKGQQIH